jgi:hypothetical protein
VSVCQNLIGVGSCLTLKRLNIDRSDIKSPVNEDRSSLASSLALLIMLASYRLRLSINASTSTSGDTVALGPNKQRVRLMRNYII